MSTEFNCSRDCCHYKITPYNKQINWDNNNEHWKSGRIIKAGSFIMDSRTAKVLLVQSRGQLWGPPKGTMLDNETCEECAVREVFEETGLITHPSQFLTQTLIKNKALYYTIELPEDTFEVQSHIKDNDANGIGWFNIDCLLELIEEQKIKLNQHCKLLIKKFFRKNIV